MNIGLIFSKNSFSRSNALMHGVGVPMRIITNHFKLNGRLICSVSNQPRVEILRYYHKSKISIIN